MDSIWSRAEQNDNDVLRAIGYNSHCTVEHAIGVAGNAAVVRLYGAGLVTRSEEWTGCLVLTEEGRARLRNLDEVDGYI